MRRMTTAAFALLLLAGTAPTALAQEQGQGGRAHEHGGAERPTHPRGEAHERAIQGGQPGWRHAQPQPAPAPAPPQARPAPAPPAPQSPRAERFQGGRDGHWDGERRPADGPQGSGHGDHRDRDRWAGQGGDHRGDSAWSRGDWNRGDWRGRPQWRPGAYPHSFHSAHRYRIGPYIRPPHFYAHVWTFGEVLPVDWYAPDYLIEDWWNYDLPAPPPGFDWVRVGDDALLIDEYTGQVAQVVRQLFW